MYLTGGCFGIINSLDFVHIQVEHKREALLFYDSQSTLYTALNPVFHERTKHIEIDCHVFRDKVLAKVIKLIHVDRKSVV